jgi:hypothetical protein
MSVTALMVFMVISQMLVAGYLLYSFNDVEREARKRNADLRAHIDAVAADLESRLRSGSGISGTGVETPPRKRAAG